MMFEGTEMQRLSNCPRSYSQWGIESGLHLRQSVSRTAGLITIRWYAENIDESELVLASFSTGCVKGGIR